MKLKFYAITVLVGITIFAYGQRSTIELAFSAVNSTTYIQLDSIKIMNRTQTGDTVLVFPDTVLLLDLLVTLPEAGIEDHRFQVFQNYPNPLSDQTTIKIYVPDKDKVSISITDVLGRVLLKKERLLSAGINSFRFKPGNGNLFIFNATWGKKASSIKILVNGYAATGACELEYLTNETSPPSLKAQKITRAFPFMPGDDLLYVGYIDDMQSGILDSPEDSRQYTFQFASNIPCPGMPEVEYEGQVYNTVQIFSQCWLKENLNAGIIIPAEQNMADNDTLERFCYYNEPDSCTKYGALYQWNEMMQYTTQPRPQGICPEGWHLPDDEEWKLLEGATDSHYRIGDPEWDDYDTRGYDAGDHLKAVDGWSYGGGGTDQYGFSALPGGQYIYGMVFDDILYAGHWWTSTEYGEFPWVHTLRSNEDRVNRFSGYYIGFGLSVRCVRDEDYTLPLELTFSAINDISFVQLDSIKVMNRTQEEEVVLHYPDTTLLLIDELVFDDGDELLFIGYADTVESGILDTPDESETYIFQFATNIPCPGTPTVEYEGQTYNTIQIFSQCWLKENLNVGTMIQGPDSMTDNGIIEKYCYNNNPDSCIKYGGLYQWNELMQYTEQEGAQGICPQGWHIPADEECKVLEGVADSQYGIGDAVWEYMFYRGEDAGTNLKSDTGWHYNYNGTDLFGFSFLPGGLGDSGWYYYFEAVTYEGTWWTSTVENYNGFPWYRRLKFDVFGGIERASNYGRTFGMSVRCLKDQ